MAHVDPERLILVAFGEQQLSAPEAEHLRSCETCASELSEDGEVIRLGREAPQSRDLPEAPHELWQRIAEEAFARPHAVPDAPSEPEAFGHRQPARGSMTQRRYRQLGRSGLLALCAAMVGVAATLGAQWLSEKPQKVVAEASLLSKNVAAPSARGTATIIETDDGLQMKVDVSGMPPTDGYYAVWVYDGASSMISVGTLGAAPLNLPTSIRDISDFPVVDISLQEIGQQDHGVTMLQGEIDR